MTIAEVQEEMKRAWNGPCWYGPSLKRALAGVDAARAAAEPLPGAHRIQTIVLHLAGWNEVVRKRLEGKGGRLSGTRNFPPVARADEAEWKRAMRELAASYQALLDAVESLRDEDLRRKLAGQYDVEFMLKGVIQHWVYHAGQISMLKKHG